MIIEDITAPRNGPFLQKRAGVRAQVMKTVCIAIQLRQAVFTIEPTLCSRSVALSTSLNFVKAGLRR
jgi:hypothetical protein